MKECTKCGNLKPLNDFSKRSVSKDGHSSQCKTCTREHTRNHYQKNKKYYKDKARRNDVKYVQWFLDYKSKLSCERCGESRWWVLDFHHTDPKQKDGNVAKFVKNRNKSKFLEEVKKCEVLCANCHRDHHYQERLK